MPSTLPPRGPLSALTSLVLVGLVLAVAGLASAGPAEDEYAYWENRDIEMRSPIMLSPAEWQRLAPNIASRPQAAAAFEGVVSRAELYLTQAPRPVDQVIYEGRIEANPGRVHTKIALQDMEKIRDLIWAEAYTGDDRFGVKARQYTMAWVNTTEVNGNAINMNKLDAIIESYDRYRDDFAEGDRAKVETWLNKMASDILIEHQQRPNQQGNWVSKRLKLVGMIGTTLGNPEQIDHAAEGFRRYVIDNIYPDGDTFDRQHRDSLSYHTGGVRPLLDIALPLRRSGYDLFRYEAPHDGEPDGGGSIRKALDFLVPYADGDPVYIDYVNSSVPFDHTRWPDGKVWKPSDSWKVFDMASFFDADYSDEADLVDEDNRRHFLDLWVQGAYQYGVTRNPDAPNLIENGDFTSGAGWELEQLKGHTTVTIANGEAMLSISGAGGGNRPESPEDVIYRYVMGDDATGDGPRFLWFDLRTEGDAAKLIDVLLRNAEGEAIWSARDLAIHPELGWHNFLYDLPTDLDLSNAMLEFHVGSDRTDVAIRSVGLIPEPAILTTLTLTSLLLARPQHARHP